MRKWLLPASLVLGVLSGCGTTRYSDTQRTATEQLLLSDAIDRAVGQVDFRVLAGKNVYLDASALKTATDAPYLTSSLRQQMLAQGCIVKDRREDADYVVEARAGAVGTDHRAVLFGMPATRLPDGMAIPGSSATIPEIPLAKKTEQRAVAKVALFAYNRETGRPVWQSGTVPVESKVKDLWVLGAGPFQRGSIVEGPKLLADKGKKPARGAKENLAAHSPDVPGVTEQAFFPEPKRLIASSHAKPDNKTDAKNTAAKSDTKPAETSPLDSVVPAAHTEPAPVTSGPNAGMDKFWPLTPPPPQPAVPPAGSQSGLSQPVTPIEDFLQAFPLGGKT